MVLGDLIFRSLWGSGYGGSNCLGAWLRIQSSEGAWLRIQSSEEVASLTLIKGECRGYIGVIWAYMGLYRV